jgi:glycosyltransferase involved in cell wall biosynthesis
MSKTSGQPQSFNPLVTILIPAYNAGQYISSTLDSAIAQTYKNLEILVIDDGSCDNTSEIVCRYAQKNKQIRLIQQKNSGVAAARNQGIYEARGEFIAPIDADDIWHPQALSKLICEFEKCDFDTGVVYTWSIDIDEVDQPTGGFHAAMVNGDIHKTLICHNFIGNASSTLIRKSYLEQVSGYGTYLKADDAQGCEDWDLYLRLAEICNFRVVPEFLVGYRKSNSSMSGNLHRMAKSHQMMLNQVELRCPEIPKYLYRLSSSSFYLYLARQSYDSSNPKQALSWLLKAIKFDPITPFFRLGMYILVIKALIDIGSQKNLALQVVVRSVQYRTQYVAEQLAHSRQSRKSFRDSKIILTELESLFSVNLRMTRFKVIVSSILHHAIKLSVYEFSHTNVKKKEYSSSI